MSEELKSTQIVYGENVLMMRVDDCLIFGNKNALRSLAEKLTKLPSAELERTAKVKNVDEINIHCGNCDTPLSDWWTYCPSCGIRLEWK